MDARNIRNIVLMRPINSMIEFKQIIGRGTRLYDGKDYFTIYDFVKAHHHFSDPEWDGEPTGGRSHVPNAANAPVSARWNRRTLRRLRPESVRVSERACPKCGALRCMQRRKR